MREGNQFIVDGLSRKNPLTMSDRPIHEHALADGDEFDMCGIRFRFRLDAQGAGRHRGVTLSGSTNDQHGYNPEDTDLPSRRARPTRGASFDDAPVGLDDTNPVHRATGGARLGAQLEDERDFGGDDEDYFDDEDEDDTEAIDLDELRPAARKRSSPAVSSPRRAPPKPQVPSGIVFGDEDGADDEDDATNEFDVIGASQRQGSASNTNSESEAERTVELNSAKPLDPNDPDYDPFAEVDAAKGPKRESGDPQREKLLRMISLLGLVGVLITGGTVWILTRPKEWTRQVRPDSILVRLDETVQYEHLWSSQDPPRDRRATNLKGDPFLIAKDAIAQVEWAVPNINDKALFLITGLAEGDTSFELVFPESRRILEFPVQVEGDPPHESLREERRDRFRSMPVRELRDLFEEYSRKVQSLVQDRDVPSKESNYWLAIQSAEIAADAAVVRRELISQQGTVPEDVVQDVRLSEEMESEMREDYEQFVQRKVALYRSSLASDPKEAQIDRLNSALRAIADECDEDYQRFFLILEEVLQGKFEGDRTYRSDQDPLLNER